MKWIIYMICVCLFCRAVHTAEDVIQFGSKIKTTGNCGATFLKAGTSNEISCKSSVQDQKVVWYDPSGNAVKPIPSNRIFVKDHFVKSQPSLRERFLYFNEILVQDGGIYECRSGNITKNCSICVLDPVTFIDTPEELNVDKGRSISLTCRFKGDPEPNIMWFRNGEMISGDDDSRKYKVLKKYNTQWYEGFLTIVSLEPEDSGVYTCVALQENQLVADCTNTESYNVTLNVNYGPIFEKEIHTSKFVYARYNESVELKCAAKGYPIPTYRWFHELGDILSEIIEHKGRLQVSIQESSYFMKANDDIFGQNFSCQATNPYGISYKHFTVLKLEKPKKPSGITVLNSTSDRIDFNVIWPTDKLLFPIDSFEFQYFKKETGDTPREFNWDQAYTIYTIKITDFERNFNVDEEFYVTVPNLIEDTEYWVRLRVVNEAGESSWSTPILVSTVSSPKESENYTSVVYDRNENVDFTSYGLIFGAAILVAAVMCMLLRK